MQSVGRLFLRDVAFLLRHKLYKSESTDEPFDLKLKNLSFPYRWRYDILRALEAFVMVGANYDERMADAIDEIVKKRRSDGTWPLQAKHPGQTHFEMEKVGKPSRWNTLRALKVLKHFKVDSAQICPEGQSHSGHHNKSLK